MVEQQFDIKRKLKIPCWCFFFLMICGGPISFSFAQDSIIQRVEIPSSINPVGSGARALGMGGAFIAVADDATAASWNPGGLIQLETPEVSVVGAHFQRIEDNTFGTNPEASGSQDVSKSNINYLSAAYPFTLWGHNMITSINYQNLYDFTRKWNFLLIQDSPSERLSSLNRNIEYEQEGSISALGIAYCVQVTPRFSLGFTLNFWEDSLYDNRWKKSYHEQSSGTYLDTFSFTSEQTITDQYSFRGFNVNIGVLWNVTSKLTLGAVFKTPFEADLRHEYKYGGMIDFPDDPGLSDTESDSFIEDETLEMPMSFGIGIAYRFSDKFTSSIDIYRTEWDDFVLTDSEGNRTSPITNQSISESEIDPTYQVRMGAEYLFITPKYVVPLRGGIFYDPSPAEGNPDDYFGFSIGSGIAYGRFIFDAAYQYRFGNEVGTFIMENLEFSQDVKEHTFYSSVIIHF